MNYPESLITQAESIRNFIKQPWMSNDDLFEIKTVLDTQGFSIDDICKRLTIAKESEFELTKHSIILEILRITEN